LSQERENQERRNSQNLPTIDENPHGVGITTAIATGGNKPSENKHNPLPFYDTMNDSYFIKL
jgi:hypothetical protein